MPGDTCSPHLPAPPTASPQCTQGLGVRAGLCARPPPAAERLPGRRHQGLECGQLHAHRRDQGSRQPHQRHLHQRQAHLHRLQVGTGQRGLLAPRPVPAGQAGWGSRSCPCGLALAWAERLVVGPQAGLCPLSPGPHTAPPAVTARPQLRPGQGTPRPSAPGEPLVVGVSSSSSLFRPRLLSPPVSSASPPLSPHSDCRVKLWNYVPGLTPCLPRRVLAIKGRATTMP